jgi:hypothetical protein
MSANRLHRIFSFKLLCNNLDWHLFFQILYGNEQLQQYNTKIQFFVAVLLICYRLKEFRSGIAYQDYIQRLLLSLDFYSEIALLIILTFYTCCQKLLCCCDCGSARALEDETGQLKTDFYSVKRFVSDEMDVSVLNAGVIADNAHHRVKVIIICHEIKCSDLGGCNI